MPRIANSLKAGKILPPRRLGLAEMAEKLGFPANSLAGEQGGSDPGTETRNHRAGKFRETALAASRRP
jgi:hypothetical protein